MFLEISLSYKIQKWIVIIFSFIALGLVTVLLLFKEMEDRPHVTVNGQKIFYFERGDEKIFFLPSCVREEDIEEWNVFWGNEVTFMQSENIPAIFVNTNSCSTDILFENTENKEAGEIIILNEDGCLLYKEKVKNIKGHGNKSFIETDKKSLAVTLFEEVGLLGNAKGKKYVLVSNNYDTTLIRNDIVEKMAMHMSLSQNKGSFVDLYINGEYYGNYYFTANIEVADEKINITKLEDAIDGITDSHYEDFEAYQNDYLQALSFDVPPEIDITGGYVVEREYRDRWDEEKEKKSSLFTTKNNENFVIKYPRFCSNEQVEYLTELFDNAELAILSKNGINPYTNQHYTYYIDEDSFVKKYVLEEVCKNYDGGVTSSFFYKDCDGIDSKIKAGPIWDYDLTWGNYKHRDMQVIEESPMGVTKLSLNANSTSWFSSLYEKETFYEKVCELYQDGISGYLADLANNEIDQYKELLDASWDMNYIRWQEEMDAKECFVDKETSYEELKKYISERKAFLDSAWIEGKKYNIVVFKKDNANIEIRYIESGKTLGEMPITDISTKWESNTIGVVDSNTKIYTDMTITGNVIE